jgi:hypothetical protein
LVPEFKAGSRHPEWHVTPDAGVHALPSFGIGGQSSLNRDSLKFSVESLKFKKPETWNSKLLTGNS